jgi:hypothetical protein
LGLHERRQGKRVARVLLTEDAEEKTVYHEKDAAPREESHALRPGVAHPWNFDGQGNAGKSEDTICVGVRTDTGGDFKTKEG